MEGALGTEKGKTCENEREKGKKGRKIIKGDRGRNIKTKGKKSEPKIPSGRRSSKCRKYQPKKGKEGDQWD